MSFFFFFELGKYLLKMIAFRDLMALKLNSGLWKLGWDVNQEPGCEESGPCDIAEEAGKAGLMEGATRGLQAWRWKLCRGVVRIENFLLSAWCLS